MSDDDPRRFDPQGMVRLDPRECWRFLERHWLGRVALVHMDQPMVFPVSYAVDGQTVVFRTAPGTKLSLAGVGIQVAFEVDEASELFETGTSVVVHGTMREVKDRAERLRLSSLRLRTWAPGDRDHYVVITPSFVTGREIPHRPPDALGADAG
jgi:nitroimidazol reductase NimA-like FMN-containing flavoprotein (pyridoxamine 5'-phosphate oxidase superfamily)